MKSMSKSQLLKFLMKFMKLTDLSFQINFKCSLLKHLQLNSKDIQSKIRRFEEIKQWPSIKSWNFIKLSQWIWHKLSHQKLIHLPISESPLIMHLKDNLGPDFQTLKKTKLSWNLRFRNKKSSKNTSKTFGKRNENKTSNEESNLNHDVVVYDLVTIDF